MIRLRHIPVICSQMMSLPGFVSVNSESNRLSSDYKNSIGFYSSYDDCKVFATPQPSINDSRPCTSQMLGNPNSNISESASIRTGVRYTAKINALIMSDCSDGISNCEHYFTYNKSMENLFSIPDNRCRLYPQYGR